MSIARKKMRLSSCWLATALHIMFVAGPVYAVSNTRDTLATQIASAKSTLAEATRAANNLSTASVCLEKKSKAMFFDRGKAEVKLGDALKARQSLENATTPLKADYEIKQKSLTEAQKKSHELSEAYSQANEYLAHLNTLWQRCLDASPLARIALVTPCAAGALIAKAAGQAQAIDQKIQNNNKIVAKAESETASANTALNEAQSKLDQNQAAINGQNKIITDTGNRIKFISSHRGTIENLAFSMRKESNVLSVKITSAENINYSDERVNRLSRDLSEKQNQLNHSIENQRNIFSESDSILTPNWRNECKL